MPCGNRRNNDLTGQTLIRLQESLNDIDYIVIDEYSMLGQVTFGWVDKNNDFCLTARLFFQVPMYSIMKQRENLMLHQNSFQ